ncbi:MAG TPA: ribonuclease P protein component [Candidatus Saccharimonadales bacterium]|nr:ribonuclease P protein component [Candidatus Saccharimonadales bacterium]
MLASKYRFHGHAALKYIFSHGKTYRLKSLSIRVAHNQRRELSRVAVVISKKVIKASPKRNRVRRRVFEVLRTEWEHIKSAQDILISVYDASVLDMTHEELVAEVRKGLEAAHVWV